MRRDADGVFLFRSGADLSALVREAAMNALRNDKVYVSLSLSLPVSVSVAFSVCVCFSLALLLTALMQGCMHGRFRCCV